MRTAAVLPVKCFGRAKSRLGDRADRPELAAAMAGDVLAALEAAGGLAEILVVSPERPSGAHRRVVWVADEEERGHVPAALLGVRAARERGAGRVLLVPGDCPGLDPADVEELLAAPAIPSLTVVPDRHGAGTNGLLLCPPDAIVPSFGTGSFARHAARGRAAGLPVRVASPPSLLMDVDTPEDLGALLTVLPAGSAPRTRALLPVPA